MAGLVGAERALSLVEVAPEAGLADDNTMHARTAGNTIRTRSQIQ